MKNFDKKYKKNRTLIHLNKLTVTKIIVHCTFLFLASSALASNPENSQSAGNEKCLRCHSIEQLSTTLENGETLSLHIPGKLLEKSVHHWLDCNNCHQNIDIDTHMLSENKKKYANKREHSIALSMICHNCHQDKSHLYKGSIHASLVESGNNSAPVCTDCHGSHTVKPKATYETLAGVPCKNCHINIFNIYLESMHGKARSKLGHIQAPICADCHHAHDINLAATESRLKEACLGCHEGTKDAHSKWLPNAGQHLQSVSCAACHAPAAKRQVDLMLYDSVAQRPITENEISSRLGDQSGPEETGKGGLDAKELWNLVRGINQDKTAAEVILKGRIELATGEQAHQIALKDKALRDCDSCHRNGAEPFQNVTVSLIGADGKRVSYDTEKGILNSVFSADSVGEFYAVGGTRIKLLDILLLFVVVSGTSVIIVHLAMRRLLRKDK